MEAQHCKLLICAKRKVQENKRQKPGVDLAARIFCPQGNQTGEKGEKKRRTVIAFTADSDGIPGQKETQTGRRVPKVSEQLAVIESYLSWRLLALSASPTAGIVPALRY